MRCGGRTLAMATMLTARDCRYAFKLAFDEEFRKQAPGRPADRGGGREPPERHGRLRRLLLRPGNETLNRLWPDRRPLVSVVLARPGVRAGVIKRALRVAGVVRAADAAA